MYLLDTNALIILLYGEVADGKLTESSRNIMQSSDKLFISMASLWEMAIKIKLAKLEIKKTILEVEQSCIKNGVQIIPIRTKHINHTVKMPLLPDHRDPFDRLILATALSEDMTLISTDERMRKKEYSGYPWWATFMRAHFFDCFFCSEEAPPR